MIEQNVTVTGHTAGSNEFTAESRVTLGALTFVASPRGRRATRSAMTTWSILTRRTVNHSDQLHRVCGKLELHTVDQHSAYTTYGNNQSPAKSDPFSVLTMITNIAPSYH